MSLLVLISILVFFSLSTSLMALSSVDDLVVEHFSFDSIRNFTSGLVGLFDSMDSKDIVHNMNNQKDVLIVLGAHFKNHNSGTDGLASLGNLMDHYISDDDIEPDVIGIPLVFPNPFRQSSVNGGVLSYDLSKDMDIEIHIYNMLAQRVFKQTYIKGSPGASRHNKLRINQDSLGGYSLSSGVYFYVIIHADQVLAKGKMVVKP